MMDPPDRQRKPFGAAHGMVPAATMFPGIRADVCVVGASAGGVQALRTMLARLPADHPGCVLVVLHLAPDGPSLLAEILGRACALPCETARHGAPLTPGLVQVASPDRHLCVTDGAIRLDTGPRERGLRPSVDALFRSAAAALGPRVLGIVLSGTRTDGTAGLAAIKRAGGTTAVQDPGDALYDGMPRSAMEQVAIDVVADALGLGDLIASAAARR